MENMRVAAGHAARRYVFVMGPLIGGLTAWLWGDGSASWLATGVILGLAAELVAVLASERERKPGGRAIAFFLAFQAIITTIPFLSLSGVIEMRADALASFHVSQLALIPFASAAASVIRQLLRPEHPPERRARPPREEPDQTYVRWLWILGALTILMTMAAADAITPSPYSLAFLYALPPLLVTWKAGPRAGLLLAVFAAEAHGIVRGFSYPGGLEPLLVATDTALIMGGLAAGVILLWKILDDSRLAEKAARTDLLTGLSNRMDFLEKVEEAVARAGRDGAPISIAYLDLDGFKAVNDNYGHSVGDEVLRIVAGALGTSIRAEDLAARFGGDEFAILLPDADPDVAPRIAERVRVEIEDRMHAFHWDVTCSVGMVTSTNPSPSTAELLKHADDLMYQVKREGKNALKQVVVR